jgi:pimeloyl-ACP methyl ester carboxylesterase
MDRFATTTMNQPEKIHLVDGRAVTYALYGAPERRRWVVYLHGFPGSRLEGEVCDAAARRVGISVVAPDRPGFGSSDGQSERCVGDWAQDIRAVCAALGIERAAIIGVSGGGPYALACAAGAPEIVAATHVVSGLAPPGAPGVLDGMALGNRLMFRVGHGLPGLARILTRAIGASWAASPRLCLAWFRTFVPPVDRRILDRPDVRVMMLNNIRCAFERRSGGAVDDFAALNAPWGFELTAINRPTTVWHGHADTYVPPAMGAYLAASVPGATLREFPAAGHLLILEILDDLFAAIRAELGQ